MVRALKFFLLGSLYAILLSSSERIRFWVADQTWASVVLGTGMVLGLLWHEDREKAEWSFWGFFWAGIPIIIRSLFFDNHREWKRVQGRW